MVAYKSVSHFDAVVCSQPIEYHQPTSDDKHGPMPVVGTTTTPLGIVVSIVYQCLICGDVVVCTP